MQQAPRSGGAFSQTGRDLVRLLSRAVPAVLAGALAFSTLPAQAVGTQSPAGLRLFSPDRHPVLTVYNDGQDQWIDFNPAIYLGSKRSRFEIDVRRPNANRRLTATVRVDGRTRKVPGRFLQGWNGLHNAFTITWRTPDGSLLSSRRTDWCPNDGRPSRLGPHAAAETAFAYGCGMHPFTRGMRWGIDRGWARQVLGYGIEIPVEDLGDEVGLEVKLSPGLARAFGLTEPRATIRFDVTVKHVTDPVDPGEPEPDQVPDGTGLTGASARAARQAPSAARGTLAPGVLPDLISLPAFGMATHNEAGRDLLDFAATVYNGGPAPLVAEGFRRGSTPVMDAYQFFYRGDRQVASRRVGSMEFDSRDSHQHWHFKDFAVYDLVDANHKRRRTSGKEAFCLAPTDAINLLRRGAVANPGNGDLSTACGDIASVWVREVLASGWGDTYSQQRAGQSIDITGLPNGTYWVRVTANPERRLHETTRRNNVSLRRVILGGTPGNRTVTVPKYGLIDSETPYASDGGH